MSRKRRVFDIELPGDSLPDAAPEAPQRRGPMASAIAENAGALKERRDAEAEIRAETPRAPLRTESSRRMLETN